MRTIWLLRFLLIGLLIGIAWMAILSETTLAQEKISQNPVVPDGKFGPFCHRTLVAKPSKGELVLVPSSSVATHTHPGVDFIAHCGSPIYASADGDVIDMIDSNKDTDSRFLGYEDPSVLFLQYVSASKQESVKRKIIGEAYVNILSGHLNVREGKGTNYRVVATLLNGEKVQLLDISDIWYKVRLSDGTVGYVDSRYLIISKPGQQLVTTAQKSPSSVVIITGETVNIRSGPSALHKVIGKVHKDESYQILEEKEGWYRIQLSGGKEGWVYGKQVVVKAGPSDTTVMGILSMGQDEKLSLIPLVVYEGEKYQSVYIECWNKNRERVHSVQQSLGGVNKLWLYFKGTLIGSFKVTDFKDLCEEYGPQVALAGEVSWQSKPSTDLYEFVYDVVALSQPIPQPFWPKELRLNASQASKLDQVLNETLMRAPVLLAEALKQRGIQNRSPQRSIGATPKSRSVDIMDLDQDGQPEVYATVRWEGEPCAEISGSVLATWAGSWKVLRRSTYMAECPWFESVGDDHFDVSVIDINGDGVAELMMREGRWESWEQALYQVRDGKLVKILDIGAYGL